jgi:hypothetical protein
MKRSFAWAAETSGVAGERTTEAPTAAMPSARPGDKPVAERENVVTMSILLIDASRHQTLGRALLRAREMRRKLG